MTLAKSTLEFEWVSQKQASDLYLIVVVVKDTVSMVLEISYLQVVFLSADLQSNVFIGAMADLIPQVLVWDTLDVLLQVNILMCAISSRPDLFVAMHDVSLMTPTQEGRLMAATTDMADVYLLWVERDGVLLFCVKHRWQL
ncbi:hypothetical protein O0I10_013117 [Lichtheimia ornata]|uniref:Uncharacterized protein n=1 Tax=Lichtheimia ornata TaxID=688661 RepID=A0AAD7XR59_9FUNG|nr:uncharacterized protein O0I10_013117 [Lichtheimia ornata]KAJ8651365.1 hypothetical protein O0I10_013117 [Lichtheimia ornata]